MTDSAVRRRRAAGPEIPRQDEQVVLDKPDGVLRRRQAAHGGLAIAPLGEPALVAQNDPRVADWIELLYGQALVAEGAPLEDPGAFVKRITSLLTAASHQPQSPSS